MYPSEEKKGHKCMVPLILWIVIELVCRAWLNEFVDDGRFCLVLNCSSWLFRLLPKRINGASTLLKSIASRGVRIRRWWPLEAWTLPLSFGALRNPTNTSSSRVRILFIVCLFPVCFIHLKKKKSDRRRYGCENVLWGNQRFYFHHLVISH